MRGVRTGSQAKKTQEEVKIEDRVLEWRNLDIDRAKEKDVGC